MPLLSLSTRNSRKGWWVVLFKHLLCIWMNKPPKSAFFRVCHKSGSTNTSTTFTLRPSVASHCTLDKALIPRGLQGPASCPFAYLFTVLQLFSVPLMGHAVSYPTDLAHTVLFHLKCPYCLPNWLTSIHPSSHRLNAAFSESSSLASQSK